MASSSNVRELTTATNLPTPIWEVGAAVDALTLAVAGMTASLKQVQATQATMYQAIADLKLAIGNITLQLQAFATDQINTIGNDTVNIINLIETLIQGLGSLANESDLQTVLQLVTIIRDSIIPPTIGLDLTSSATAEQPKPTQPGP